jgi:hypothetical protein
MAMGFSRAQTERALRQTNSVGAAAEWLLAQQRAPHKPRRGQARQAPPFRSHDTGYDTDTAEAGRDEHPPSVLSQRAPMLPPPAAPPARLAEEGESQLADASDAGRRTRGRAAAMPVAARHHKAAAAALSPRRSRGRSRDAHMSPVRAPSPRRSRAATAAAAAAAGAKTTGKRAAEQPARRSKRGAHEETQEMMRPAVRDDAEVFQPGPMPDGWGMSEDEQNPAPAPAPAATPVTPSRSQAAVQAALSPLGRRMGTQQQPAFLRDLLPALSPMAFAVFDPKLPRFKVMRA